MPGVRGLISNVFAAGSSPGTWKLAREAIVQRGAMQHVDELTPFAKRVRALAPQTVLEIGTAQGGVFWLLCQLAREDAILVSLDLPPDDRFSGGKKVALDLPALRRPGQTVHVVQGDSHAEEMLDRVRESLAARPLDLLFIDGDHTYEGVRRDHEMYGPLVRPGGLIAFHDIVKTPWPACGVDRYWAELMQQRHLSPRQIVGLFKSHFGGIGLLTQP